MSYPVLEQPVVTKLFDSQTSYDVDMPATVRRGELLVVKIHVGEQNESISTPAGWTEGLSAHTGIGRINIFHKKADGSEGGTTVTFSQKYSPTNSDTISKVYRYSNWSDIAFGTMANGGNYSSIDVPSLDPPWGAEDATFITGLGVGSPGSAIYTPPSGYIIDDNSTTAAGTRFATARRKATVDIEDPDTWDLNSTYYCGTYVMAIRGPELNDNPYLDVPWSSTPTSDQTDYVGFYDLSNAPQSWWDEVDTSDGNKLRVAKDDVYDSTSATQLAFDVENFDDVNQTGHLYFR